MPGVGFHESGLDRRFDLEIDAGREVAITVGGQPADVSLSLPRIPAPISTACSVARTRLVASASTLRGGKLTSSNVVLQGWRPAQLIVTAAEHAFIMLPPVAG